MHEDLFEAEQEKEAESSMIARGKRFRCDNNKVDTLIRCLANYKTQMEFKNSDFNADNVKQYEAVRFEMATIYASDPSQFGPPSAATSPLINQSDDSLNEDKKLEKQKLRKQQEEEKKLIKRGTSVFMKD